VATLHRLILLAAAGERVPSGEMELLLLPVVEAMEPLQLLVARLLPTLAVAVEQARTVAL
jgi:hypothetical protein